VRIANTTCGYGHAGTFGHECGRPAVVAGAKPSESTKSGIFWSARCADCKELTGRDNWGITRWEPLDPAKHVNEWGRSMSVAATPEDLANDAMLKARQE
jgi:hypothetical protein